MEGAAHAYLSMEAENHFDKYCYEGLGSSCLIILTIDPSENKLLKKNKTCFERVFKQWNCIVLKDVPKGRHEE